MKKIFLFTHLLSSLIIKAQLTEANHAPTSGDVFATNQCDSVGIVPGSSGSSSFWDYSAISIHTSLTSSFTSAVSTNTNNPGYLVVSSSPLNSSYYSSTPSELKYFGGNLTVGAFNLSLTYTSPAIVASYPMGLNTSTTSIIGGTGFVSVIGNISFTGNCTAKIDGTGTLVIGANTFTNAIRVKTAQTLSLNGGVASVDYVTYDYYSIDKSKRPLLTITNNTLTISFPFSANSQTLVTIQKNYLTVGEEENYLQANETFVYPNPSNGIVNFSAVRSNARKILIQDVVGKIIASDYFVYDKVEFNLSNLNVGLYFYSILDANNLPIKKGKFNILK